MSLSPSNSPDFRALLEAYVSSGRSERTFSELIVPLAPLVYSSALRRTGDPQIAEDVSQKVFALLARKAPSLRSHPSLIGWLFQTTRFEAANALRSEARRKRAIQAFAQETHTLNRNMPSPDEIAGWKDALPVLDESLDLLNEKERQLVLDRFYQQHSFAEIAARTGSTEAACKMRLKRTLGKLSQILRRRGVTLSAATITSGLGAELARATPHTIGLIASNALTASKSITTSTIIFNSIQTMSAIKSASLTSAAIFLLASVPLILQQIVANDRSDTLAELESTRSAILKEITVIPNIDQRSSISTSTTTIGELLASASQSLTAKQLIDAVMELMYTGDVMDMVRVFLPIGVLTDAERERLINETRVADGHKQAKEMALQLLLVMGASQDSPKDVLEKMLSVGDDPASYVGLLAQWAATEPDAAYDWYQQKLDSGEFAGNSIDDKSGEQMMSGLIVGMADTNFERALSLFSKMTNGLPRYQTILKLASKQGEKIKTTGDEDEFALMFDQLVDSREQISAVSAAIETWKQKAKWGEGIAFAERYLISSSDRYTAIANLIMSAPTLPFNERVEGLISHIPSDATADAIMKLIDKASWSDPVNAIKWLESQPPSEIRDRGFESLASTYMTQSQFLDALKQAHQIQDRSRQRSVLHTLGEHWLATDPAKAREYLSVDLITELEGNPAVR